MAAIIGCLSFERVFLALSFVHLPLVVWSAFDKRECPQPLKRQTIVQFKRGSAAARNRVTAGFTDTSVALRAVKGFAQLATGFFNEFVKELGPTGKTRLFQSELSFTTLQGPRFLITTRAQGKQ